MNIIITPGGIVKPPARSSSYQALMTNIARIRVSERKLATAKQDRRTYLEDLSRQFHAGEIHIDLDDPRTTVGLTESEVAFVMGIVCWVCQKRQCRCDDEYQEVKEAA